MTAEWGSTFEDFASVAGKGDRFKLSGLPRRPGHSGCERRFKRVVGLDEAEFVVTVTGTPLSLVCILISSALS